MERHKKFPKKTLSSILTLWSSGLSPCSPLVFLLSSQYLISGFSRFRQNVQRNSPLRLETNYLIRHFNVKLVGGGGHSFKWMVKLQRSRSSVRHLFRHLE